MEEYIKLIDKQKQEKNNKTINLKFNELIIEDLEEDYRRMSNTFDSKNLAEEAANKFRLKGQSNALPNQIHNDGFEELHFDFDDISTTAPAHVHAHDTAAIVKDATTVQDQIIFNGSGSKAPKDFRVNSASVPARINTPSDYNSANKFRDSAGKGSEIDSEDSFLIYEHHHHLKQNEALMLSSFTKLLLIDEKDEFFDNWSNFYSNEFIEAFESLYKEYNANLHKNRKLDYEFGDPITFVKNRDDGSVNQNLLFKFIEDFDANLFEGYSNTYSKEYDENSIKEGLWKTLLNMS